MPAASNASPIALFIFFVLIVLTAVSVVPQLLTNRRISEARNKMIKIAKRMRAIPTAAPAIPVNPNTPAINAIIKKMSVHPNIKPLLSYFQI
jgi:hypothetical protein